MIVIKEKDAVYFARPITDLRCYSEYNIDYSFEENGNIWHLNDEYGTIVMADTNNSRFVDLLRYSDVFECEFSEEGMHQIVANIKDLVEGTNCFIADGMIGVNLFVARGNKVYKITTYGAVSVIDSFACVAEREEKMLAIYERCKSIPDIHQRIKEVYDKYKKKVKYFRCFDIAVISTKDKSYSLLTKK